VAGVGNSSLRGLIARRVAVTVLLLWVVSLLVFAATQVLPGDTASAILGKTATPESLAQLRAQLGLNEPVTTQYLDWLGGLLHGDLGRSLAAGIPVGDLIGDRVGATLTLAGVTLVLLVPLALLLGVLSGMKRDGKLDQVVSWVTLAGVAVPEFVTGTLLALLLATWLGWLPAVSLIPPGESPLAHPQYLVLPVLTLLIAGLASTVRLVRVGVAEAAESRYTEMARLSGIPERRVVRRWIVPNALAAGVQVIALTAQWLVGGIVIVETVFQYPGVGQTLVQSVQSQDIPVVQAVALVIAAIYVLINLLADVALVLLVPKLRTAS
jgi:peptide/nickel transport system permease protein